MRRVLLALLALATLVTPALTEEAASDAFRRLLPVEDNLRARLALGRELFEQDWTVAPGPRPGRDGLGPLFSRLSCDGCHTRAGRGAPPRGPDDPLLAMVIRLSVPGTTEDGSPLPHPLYGEQLDRNAVPGVPVEGVVSVSYDESPGQYADGTPFSLRRPRLAFTDLAYGPLGSTTMVSARVAPALAGLGLLNAVPDATLDALAAAEAREGRVHGRVNRVWDIAAQRARNGRFGWKAGQPNLRQQNASAFNRDIGITNPLYPENDCSAIERECRAAADAAPRHPKIGEEFLDAVTLYLTHLAPPRRHIADAAAAERGAALFERAGCAQCHRPSLDTGDDAGPNVSHQRIHPYTDLLLHDLGEGLADGRPEFAADGHSWRTAPLWGLGAIAAVNDHDFLLHDGRARGAAEAILWHGGEAEAAKEAFRAMSREERAALLAFLASL